MTSKKFGLSITTSLVIGTMIGSGIFLLPSSVAQYGGLGLWGWLFAALGAIALAWVFARLSAWLPGAGGPYHFTRVGIGEFPAFIVAWCYWISIWTGNAAIAIAAVSYSSVFVPELASNRLLAVALAIVFLWLITLINIKGLREAGLTQLITTLLKVVPLFLFGIIGVFYVSIDQLAEPPMVSMEPSAIIIAAASLWLWAFLGVESASIPSDNIDDPKRTIPRATLLGVAIVAFLYFLCFIVIFGTQPIASIAQSTAPFADTATLLWHPSIGKAFGLVALISTLGALNGLVLLGGQMPLAAAKAGLFPKLFAKENKHHSPYAGIILSSILSSFLIMANFSENLVALFTFAILLSTTAILVAYLFCSAAAIRFQMQLKLQWASLAVMAFAFIFSLWAVAGAGEDAVYWGFLLVLSGIPIYTYLKIRNDQKNGTQSFNE